MQELLDKEQAVLESLIQAKANRQQIPLSERLPIGRPEKYVFPIGLDDEGKPFPVPPLWVPDSH